MSNKTILHLTGMRSTKYGALEHYFVEIASLCASKGYRSVLQYETLPQSVSYLQDLKDFNTEIRVLPTQVNLFQSLRRVIPLIAAVRPGIVLTHFVNKNILFVTPKLARLLGANQLVAMIHFNYQFKNKSPRRLAFNQYDHILAVSEAVARNLIYAGVNPKIVSTHYLGLSGLREPSLHLRTHYRQEFGIPPHAPVLACIAFDAPFKALDILLTAFAKVVHNCPQAHLIHVGVDPERSTLPAQAANLGLAGKVHWAGIRDDGWQVLNAADIYVQSSRFGEGLPLSIMEAMALKLPIVATQVAGIPEAVTDSETGYLVEAGNPDHLAEAILRLLAQPDKSKQMGEAGYGRYLELFQAKNSVKNLVENYLLPASH